MREEMEGGREGGCDGGWMVGSGMRVSRLMSCGRAGIIAVGSIAVIDNMCERFKATTRTQSQTTRPLKHCGLFFRCHPPALALRNSSHTFLLTDVLAQTPSTSVTNSDSMLNL